MTPTLRCLTLLSVALSAGPAQAQDRLAAGSSSFCLYPLSRDGNSQRHINLAIVQYVEVKDDALVLVYGGGNLGSGHESRLPAPSRDEALALLQKLKKAAADCALAAAPKKEP